VSSFFACYSHPVAKQSASRVSDIVTQLRESIFENRLPPGSSIRELTLAREMGVSQVTVRDALQRLEYAGLVTRKANLGTTVTRLSPKDVRERVTLRASLEAMAAGLAAQRMQESDFAELERRLNVLAEAIRTDRYYEASQADLEFHRYVWHCSGNDMLCRLLDLVTVPLFAFVSIMRSQGLQKLTAVVAEHSPLVDALRSKDGPRIHAAFRKGATSFYDPFLGQGGERAAAEAFGFLAVASRDQ
jgi:DNA-binding GntR family transcriptional regulator